MKTNSTHAQFHVGGWIGQSVIMSLAFIHFRFLLGVRKDSWIANPVLITTRESSKSPKILQSACTLTEHDLRLSKSSRVCNPLSQQRGINTTICRYFVNFKIINLAWSGIRTLGAHQLAELETRVSILVQTRFVLFKLTT